MPKADLAPAVPAKNRHIGTGISLAVLAAVFTLCNCVKPLQVDDAAYVLYAAHIAEHPLAPYDFAVYWGHQFQPANQVLAPPVLLYWMAGAHAVFGDNPTLWKLSLLPWHVLLTISLFSLLRRWTGALSLPLTWMALLSPALLPSTNLMLDVPALALSLTAVALFVKAAERGGWRLAALAGLVAGLAMQTKYSAFVTPWVLLCYGLTHGRLRLALLAAATALCIFAAWELFVATVHGDSHFLLAAQQRGESLLARIRHMVIPTLTLTAALAPGVLFAAVLGWRRSGRWLAVAIMVAAGGFLL
ncbi:MAG TPA: glycosyltransferase family 39 protein, partial [Gemmataceae bacterium]|nr:glycosyltransferase family 39 protein [Gemmataceae bacterium]